MNAFYARYSMHIIVWRFAETNNDSSPFPSPFSLFDPLPSRGVNEKIEAPGATRSMTRTETGATPPRTSDTSSDPDSVHRRRRMKAKPSILTCVYMYMTYIATVTFSFFLRLPLSLSLFCHKKERGKTTRTTHVFTPSIEPGASAFSDVARGHEEFKGGLEEVGACTLRTYMDTLPFWN